MPAPVSRSALRDAYRRSDLATLGISYEQAMDDPTLRRSLESSARAAARWTRTAHIRGGRWLERTSGEDE